MILAALSLLIFVVTLGLSLSLLYFMVESPLARRKMMTRLAAVQEVSIRQRRFNKFEEQFPEALDLLGRAVRAGHAFTTGFELIGNELPPPVSEEFRITFQQQKLGVPFRDAMQNMALRVPLPDVLIFVSSLQIQRESGGNLGEILDTMSNVVRERFKLRRQIQIFTAEGRLSSYVLTALPFAALALLYFVQRDYVMPM